MKIELIGEKKIIMENPDGKYNYFAWPSAERLRDGRIAVGASGFRVRHICPYGKAVVMFSDDEGESYSAPTPVIDTSLDDRDCGLAAFGENGLIVTSFNNTVRFQRKHAAPEDAAHLDAITEEDELRDLGATFRISHDGGKTFSPIYKSPVTSPHGPKELSDGTVMWLGRTFSCENAKMEKDCVKAYKVNTNDGSMEYLGEIENITVDGMSVLSCEPYAVQLENGRIVAQIRVQSSPLKVYTTYQSESFDGGRTWTKPYPVLPTFGGAPSHLLRHSSGALICTYGFRGDPYAKAPFGIRAMISLDGGESWSDYTDIYVNNISLDLGYPGTVELRDGSLLTVFYAHESAKDPAVILQQKWRIIA